MVFHGQLSISMPPPEKTFATLTFEPITLKRHQCHEYLVLSNCVYVSLNYVYTIMHSGDKVRKILSKCLSEHTAVT